MYKKSVQGWLKHLDFMILDVVCLWISFTLAFGMRHGSLNVFANSLYRDMMWSLALMDIVVIFFFDSLKNVLKRGFYHEFTVTVKQTCLITLCSVFYLFTFKEAADYSRLVLTYTAALYLLLSYITRNIWKYLLRKYLGGNGRRSLLIVTVSEIVDTVIDNIKNKNYSDYIVTGVCILDDKAKGRTIEGVPVVADKEDLVEYVCREWVDEVFLNIPESEPYPSELLDKFIEMGVVVHMKLAKSQNLLGKKQFVERLGTYTVLTTSINSVSRRQIVLKRMLDILGGLAGCIITGILCIFVGPAIYIQSPGPIFFKQTRVGKNGKLFQMYKFRSMYMDAEERKAELMKENRVQDGMMFKLDFDPRIIGSKKLPDGTIKKGVGNFIRDWSLDEFPQFLNVLKGDMSLVGTRPPTVANVLTALYQPFWFALCSPSSEEFRFQGFFSVGTLSYAWGKLYRREFLRNHQIYFADLSYAEDKLFNMQCYICDAKYAFLEDIGYIYRKNDMSVSWQYRPDSVENWFKLVYELKSWIEKKDNGWLLESGPSSGCVLL